MLKPLGGKPDQRDTEKPEEDFWAEIHRKAPDLQHALRSEEFQDTFEKTPLPAASAAIEIPRIEGLKPQVRYARVYATDHTHHLRIFGPTEGQQFCEVFGQAIAVLQQNTTRRGESPRFLDIQRQHGEQIICVADLHGLHANLTKILSAPGVWEGLQNGSTQIIFQGDYVHSEDKYALVQMQSSFETLGILSQLILWFPNQIHLSIGNHEPTKNGARKDGIEQGLLFQRSLNDYALSDVSDLYQSYLQTLLVSFRSQQDGVVGVHAGPIPLKTSMDLGLQLGQIPIEDIARTSQDLRLLHATWGRWGDYSNEVELIHLNYGEGQVQSFLSALGVPDGLLVVGHTRDRSRPDEFFWTPGANRGQSESQLLIHSAAEKVRTGYFEISDAGLRMVEVI